ncbi:hypothetical protein QBC33DRAFT_203355 [Phialemonium atrogriseum]|uniref:Peptidase S8/S53 domain-containing protein n=1 Tax=Phialemonium atrogriseum TaxID=1093897 RepID=A0AAJ0FKQ4_9PEZI|nr:uncharacterized protein QBC33DRAFT_203355 [Phialemonium atrogriseum]KAK1764325.1 hypothetical protein QBC33DRAFT_203355 [Phialemonium atrogriseum]
MAPPQTMEKDEKEAKAMENRRGKTKGPRKSDAERILSAALETDFTQPAQAQEFEIKWKEKVQKKSGSKILLVLAKKSRWPDGMQWSPAKIKEFLDWALERYHTLLAVKEDDYSPLHLAVTDGNAAFVDAVLNNQKMTSLGLGQILSETCQHGNALHIAIKHRLSLINLLIEKSARFSEIFSKGDLRSQNTPLHACMAMDLREEDEGDEEASSSSSDEDESDEDERDENERDENERNEDERDEDESDEDQHSRIHHDYDGGSASRYVLDIVELLVRKQKEVLWQLNGDKRTPYQERINQLRSSKFMETELAKADKLAADDNKLAADEEKRKAAALQTIVARDPIASFIRYYCMTQFTRDKIMTCLYQPGQERHIEFDLGGLPHPTISADYLDRLSQHLQFESILKYVALPKVTMETTTVTRKKKKSENSPIQRGLSDLVAVFDWLRRNNVTKIIRVMVVDDGDPAHADKSIVKALQGFEVEQWDWKRLDLCTDVIWKSTSVVQEISLYSTGNNAVLMGWASSQGLLSNKNFSKLKKVTLFIREGLEDGEQLKSYINGFKKRIGDGTQDRVKVYHFLDNKDVSYASDFKRTGLHLQQENSWIDCMANFARLLRTARKQDGGSVDPIKIAVIDDGVDASLVSLDSKIATGKSFCPYANSSDLISPYYVSSGNHGTCMATLISRLAPNVSLYVARLDERQSVGNGQRQIMPKSAADAIRWATSCDVHIISMSWTIETPVAGNEDMQSLETAVRDAANKNILMFCSTSDQGSSTKDICYPGDFEGCIKIGGATDTGEALAWVNAEKIDFLLPGKNVPFANNEGTVTSYESGSSVATAAASGLAGLLIYCAKLLGEGDRLQNRTNMREAFKAMSTTDKKFPRVQEYFEQHFIRELARQDGLGDKPKRLLSSYNVSTEEWNDNCRKALEWVMRLVGGSN